MEFRKIELEYVKKNGFSSASCDGIRHIKTLPYLSIVQATEGNYDIQLGKGKIHSTGIGGFFIAPSNIQQTIVHNVDKASNTMSCRWVFLKIKINELYDLDDLFDFPVIIPEVHKNEMNLIFNKLFASDNIFDEYVYYYEIVRLLFRLPKNKKHNIPLQLDNALAYIKNNYKNAITVNDIAKEVNLSASHLFSIFRNELGISPISYLNNYRLSIAADKLLKTDKAITEISAMVGINDSVYFNKMFRKAYQLSPSKYREIYKNGKE